MCESDIKRRIELALVNWCGYTAIKQIQSTNSQIRIYLAGGVVRNAVSKFRLPSKDFDFFIEGPDDGSTLSQLKAEGEVQFGPFGSPRWFPKRCPKEFADLVFVQNFYNGLDRCKRIIDVLEQFDFTANSIAYSLTTREIIDPIGGVRDVQQRIMRAVRFDYPDERISPRVTISRNCVLWFRLLHYAATLGLQIEPLTQEWLNAHTDFAQMQDEFESHFFIVHPKALSLVHVSKR